jgi:hypothetical protein
MMTVAAQPKILGLILIVRSPITRLLVAISITIIMIGPERTPFKTAVQNRAFIGFTCNMFNARPIKMAVLRMA